MQTRIGPNEVTSDPTRTGKRREGMISNRYLIQERTKGRNQILARVCDMHQVSHKELALMCG